MLVLAVFTSSALGQTAEVPSLDRLSAPAAVREANRLLKEGKAAEALSAYERAEKLRPGAPEIALGKGLAHFTEKRYDEARRYFQEAAGAKDPTLVNDALYSLAACDHAEALEREDDPKAALSGLEQAMRQYHQVLAGDPSHQAARDSNQKAAHVWRQIKHMLEQKPPQQQQQDGDEKKEDNLQEKSDQQQQQNDQQEQNQEEKQSQQSEGDPNQEQKQDQAEQQEQEAQAQEQREQTEEEQSQQPSAQEEKAQESEPSEAQQAQLEKQEQVSREQAQRRLREMIQALQQRRKRRPERIEPIPVRPVEKDW